MAQTMRHLADLTDFVPLKWRDLARIFLRGVILHYIFTLHKIVFRVPKITKDR